LVPVPTLACFTSSAVIQSARDAYSGLTAGGAFPPDSLTA
jgi:hypothetical protein